MSSFNELDGKLLELIKTHALEVKPEGEFFFLKGGGKSRFYLDCRKITLHAVGLHQVIHDLSNFVWNNLLYIPGGFNFDAIGGPCVGADPMVGALLYKLQHDMVDLFERSGTYGISQERGLEGNQDVGHIAIRGFLIRKEEKSYAKAGRIIGSVQPGDRCLLLEDVTTTGGSSLEAIDVLEEFGAKVIQVVSIVDRQEGAREAFEKRGIPFHSLISIEQILC